MSSAAKPPLVPAIRLTGLCAGSESHPAMGLFGPFSRSAVRRVRGLQRQVGMPSAAHSPTDRSDDASDRRRTPPEVREEREKELRELTNDIAARIRPALSHLEEQELLAIAREMARTEFRYRDGGRKFRF